MSESSAEKKPPIILIMILGMLGMAIIGYGALALMNRYSVSPENMERMEKMVELVERMEKSKQNGSGNEKVVRDTFIVIPPNGALKNYQPHQYTDGPHLYNNRP